MGTHPGARLIPKFEPAKLATDLVDEVGEGIDNAGALVEPEASLGLPVTSTNTDGNEALPKAELQTNESIGAVQSVDNRDTTEKSQGGSNNSTPSPPAIRDKHLCAMRPRT